MFHYKGTMVQNFFFFLFFKIDFFYDKYLLYNFCSIQILLYIKIIVFTCSAAVATWTTAVSDTNCSTAATGRRCDRDFCLCHWLYHHRCDWYNINTVPWFERGALFNELLLCTYKYYSRASLIRTIWGCPN